MTNCLTFFDVETPNKKNDSICSIGIIHINENQEKREYYSLVNPEDYFDDVNIGIHKITNATVKTSPIFSDLWNEIGEFFTKGVVVAHNACFDLSVLCKTLTRYCLPVPDFSYIDTLELARNATKCPSCELNALCDFYGIELKNHNAMSDTLACYQLFNKIFLSNDIESKIKQYQFSGYKIKSDSTIIKQLNNLSGIIEGIRVDDDINEKEIERLRQWINENRLNHSVYEIGTAISILTQLLADGKIDKYELNTLKSLCLECNSNLYSDATLAMQVLMGIIDGIVCDSQIETDQILYLHNWMNNHRQLAGNYPFDKIYDKIEKILSDGKVLIEEQKELQQIFETFLQGTTNKCNCIDFADKKFCLTGNFENGTKSEIEILIVAQGGECLPSVTAKVDFLIVGGAGSSDWKFSNYGGKVNKALQMQEKGSAIKIYSENDLISAINKTEKKQ